MSGPDVQDAKPALTCLRVLTFNLLGCRGFPLVAGGPVAFPEPAPALLAALAERLRRWRVDVAILQETPPENAMQEVARQAGMALAYFPAQSASGPDWPFGFPGAVLSTQPIASSSDRAAQVRSRGDARFQRHWGCAEVAIAGRTLQVHGLHLCADWGGVNREQVRLDELALLLSKSEGDLIGADCNTRPGEAPWRLLREAGWRDAWQEGGGVGDGWTSDSRTRMQRIDYIWLSPRSPWRVHSIQVIDTGLEVSVAGTDVLLSDHHPVLVELQWSQEGDPDIAGFPTKSM